MVPRAWLHASSTYFFSVRGKDRQEQSPWGRIHIQAAEGHQHPLCPLTNVCKRDLPPESLQNTLTNAWNTVGAYCGKCSTSSSSYTSFKAQLWCPFFQEAYQAGSLHSNPCPMAHLLQSWTPSSVPSRCPEGCRVRAWALRAVFRFPSCGVNRCNQDADSCRCPRILLVGS